MANPKTTDHVPDWAVGFSRAELLRRANFFSELACNLGRSLEQRRTDARLARDHEEAAKCLTNQ